jgi:hypothetical protein
MRFYLGTHMPHWLKDSTIPLFVSHRRLQRDKSVPKANHRWALDSGGFTELTMHGRWQTTAAEYVEAVQRYQSEVGLLDWCAPQDWMCEPHMLDKTRLSVRDHQERTIESFLELRGQTPVIPVLQGWTLSDYARCVDWYADAGVDLAAEPTVGLGSVCRRQYSDEIGEIVSSLSHLRLHGFGVKSAGIRKYGHLLTSADSMSWSYRGRRIHPCPHSGAKTCANCRPHAMEWRQRVVEPCHTPRRQ